MLDALLGGEKLHALSFRVGSGHRLSEPAGMAVLQLLHGIDAGILEQLRIGLTHALDAHPIGEIGPAEHRLLADIELFGQNLAVFCGLRPFQELFGGPNAERLQSGGHRRSDACDHADRIGHATSPSFHPGALRQPRPARVMRM